MYFKKRMRMSNKKSFLLILLIFFFTNVYFIATQYSDINNGSDYEINSGAVYRIETNLDLYHYNKLTRSYSLKNIIINFQDYNLETSNKVIPYQETLLINSTTKLNNNIRLSPISFDKFNNGFLDMNINLSFGDILSLSTIYEFKINNIDFENMKDVNVNNYNLNSEIFKLYCNDNDYFYQGSNSHLNNLSNYITGNEKNPIKIAKKINTWISDNIEYGNRYTDDYFPFRDYLFGALETYVTKQGNCRDYSDLMVTLLRIQNIPARIVRGMILDDKEPKKGEVFKYVWSNENNGYDNNYPSRHAWVEYYVPKYGWLVCDPTWSNSGKTYFNTLDLIHLRIAAGSWFSMPARPYFEGDHISLNPLRIHPYNSCNYNFTMTITVLDSKYYQTPIKFVLYHFTILILLPLLFYLKLAKDLRKKIKYNYNNS